jgi:hypothetical protein
VGLSAALSERRPPGCQPEALARVLERRATACRPRRPPSGCHPSTSHLNNPLG